jgi:hypothetical protein
MITCPWCGTHYAAFQSNCKNCGGQLPLPDKPKPVNPELEVEMPPPAPRPISDSYGWKLMRGDGWVVASSVFILLGAIFGVVGLGLTIGIVTAFVGIPFVLLGMLFFGGGGAIVYWRYQEAQKTLRVLRNGQAVKGQIISVEQNTSVEINGRNPWRIAYRFDANGRTHEGHMTTLNTPFHLQPGQPFCVLYLPNIPTYNTLYPHP